MSGGAETSIIPSLQSEVSTLSAPKNRDIARNGSESSSFSSIFNDQTRAKSPPSDHVASAGKVSTANDSGKRLPPEADKTAASGAADIDLPVKGGVNSSDPELGQQAAVAVAIDAGSLFSAIRITEGRNCRSRVEANWADRREFRHPLAADDRLVLGNSQFADQ